MKKSAQKIIILFFVFSVFGNFIFAPPAWAGFDLFKAKGAKTIYYFDRQGLRHAFPDQAAYESWYGADYSKVITASDEFLANSPLSKNITIRPGTYLVKFKSAPQVYAVETGGVLRAIKDEEVAQKIYGKNWAKKIIDIPEIFFDDYTVGKPIDYWDKIPNGSLIWDKDAKKYLYKQGNIVQPFATEQAVTDNNYRLSDVIIPERSFFEREKPITGFDKSVFNPVVGPFTDKSDCENKKLKAAVILMADKAYTSDELSQIQKIKDQISARYSWATYDLSEIDVSYPTVTVLDNGYILEKEADGTTGVKNELINAFYENNEDIFDFLIVFTDFKTPQEENSEIAHYLTVNTRMAGIGRYYLKDGESFGSTGKLKGVIMMGNINKYHFDTESNKNEVLNYILHEILHQWSAFISFTDAQGNLSKALLRSPDFSHWSYYAGFISPLGGSGWIDNKNGTFTSEISRMPDSNLRQYSKLDLYLMGLIPYQLMEPIMYVVPSTPEEIGNTIKGQAKYVSVDQIISANGKAECTNW